LKDSVRSKVSRVLVESGPVIRQLDGKPQGLTQADGWGKLVDVMLLLC
jgi:hypothetical protein